MIAYWIERFLPRVFGPAAAAIALAAQGVSSVDVYRWIADTVAAILLLAQFRLWDDLADRHQDRAMQPARVLVRAAHVRPFVILCMVLGLANTILAGVAGRGVNGLAALLLLDAAAAAWYAWRPVRRTPASDLVRLAKYPWFVIVLAAGSPAPRSHLLLAALGVYAAACAYELWHDASGPLRFNNS
jgi:hypothetical protein